MRLLLLGPPGAGKGTQAIHLAQRLGIPHLSTGEILRAVASKGTTIGREVAGIMQRGALVPDDLMVAIVRDKIAQSDARGGFILDGFPRTTTQGLALDKILDSARLSLDRVLELKVDAAMLLWIAFSNGPRTPKPAAWRRELTITKKLSGPTGPLSQANRATFGLLSF